METLVRFGPGGRLVGILSGEGLPANAPILVLPNAGLVPRAGPFRLHVQLARRLAGRGVRTFRFDLPGVGESPREAGLEYRDATLAALEQLQSDLRGVRFAVGGVCSAADLGWIAALSNQNVAGVMMLDGMCYAGPWFLLARAAAALRKGPRHWIRVARRLILRKRTCRAQRPMDLRNWPPLEEARTQMGTLLARGVRLLCIYSGGVGDYFLDTRQFRWTFGASAARNPCVRLLHWPDCDHTYFARTHRERLLDTVTDWLVEEVFSAQPSPWKAASSPAAASPVRERMA